MNHYRVTYESVDIVFPDNKEDSFPYIKDVITNNSNRKIVAYERGMMAFDKNGEPLSIYWNGMDSSSPQSYAFYYDWGTDEIEPGQPREYDEWLTKYEGKAVDVTTLESYYPLQIELR